jgi:hypothetical protein
MRHLRSAALAILATLAGASLAAQSGTVQAGTMVRATLATGASDVLVGTLVSRTPDSLTIVLRGNDAIVRLPGSSIRSIDVMNGKNRLAPGIRWALIGGGIWALVSTAIPYDKCGTSQVTYCSDSRAQFVTEQAIAMAIAAGGFAAYRGEDHWVRIEGSAPTPLITASSHGASIGVRFAR